MPLQRPPEGTHRVPWAAHTDPLQAPDHPDEGGRTLRGPAEGHPQTKGTGGQEERVDLGGHVEARR